MLNTKIRIFFRKVSDKNVIKLKHKSKKDMYPNKIKKERFNNNQKDLKTDNWKRKIRIKIIFSHLIKIIAMNSHKIQ